MNNLHISLTEFKNESRLLKQANTLIKNNRFNNVYIAAINSGNCVENEVINRNVAVKRFNLRSKKIGKNLFSQILKYFEFSFRVIFNYKQKHISVINVHSLAVLPLGVILKYIYNAKLIYDAHELETESNGLNGVRKKLSKLIERLLINKVDKTIVVSESIADWYSDFYGISRPTVVMNAPQFVQVDKQNRFREELSIKVDYKIFLYQGALFSGRGIELLLEAFKDIQDQKVAIVFMGYGTLEAQIIEASKQYPNIYFYPAVSPDIVLEYTASADVGLSIIENKCLSYYYCMPNKLFEYAMVGIPVIASNMKDMAKFVHQYKTGMIIEDNTIEQLQSAILEMSKKDISSFHQDCQSASKKFSWEIQEIKMLNIYNQLMEESC